MAAHILYYNYYNLGDCFRLAFLKVCKRTTEKLMIVKKKLPTYLKLIFKNQI